MPNIFYAVVVWFFSIVFAYFYWSRCVFLTALILSVLSLFIFVECFSVNGFIHFGFVNKKFLTSKQVYKYRRKMSNAKRMSISGSTDGGFDSGLLTNYDSRRSRSSVKSSDVLSPLRKQSKLVTPHIDENFLSKQTLSPSSRISSPVRPPIRSSFTSSPLSHSRRYNTNIDSFKEECTPHSMSPLQRDYTSTSSPNISRRQKLDV